MLREHGSQRPTVFELLDTVHKLRGTRSKFTYVRAFNHILKCIFNWFRYRALLLFNHCHLGFSLRHLNCNLNHKTAFLLGLLREAMPSKLVTKCCRLSRRCAVVDPQVRLKEGLSTMP